MKSMIDHLIQIHQKLGGINSKIIHIAGSKGKGTVAYILNEALKNRGFKVGLFTSPALFCYEEMIQINSKEISNERLLQILAEVKLASIGYELSKFEEITLAALLYFERENCDYVILEVGLGGRLDSTNIVEKKELTILTHIELEHVEILGDSIEKIANEKLGICDKDVFLLTPFGQSLEVFKAIEEKGLNYKKTPLFEIGYLNPESVGLAFAALDYLNIALSAEEIEKIKALQIPGRFEIRKFGIHTMILDGAHTFDSIINLQKNVLHFAQTKGLPEPIWVVHILKDKPKDILDLFDANRTLWVNLNHERASKAPSELVSTNAEDLLSSLVKDEIPKLIIFAGSFRLVAAIKELLGDKPRECLFV